MLDCAYMVGELGSWGVGPGANSVELAREPVE
jgi:hypothetical protein